MPKFIVAWMLIFGSAIGVFGQDIWDRARTSVNGKTVSIEYGRPNLKGRPLASLMRQLPADRIWRAGAGPMTILSTEADLSIGGKKIPAGNYSLYMYCPEKGDYALIINSDIGQPRNEPFPKAASDRANRPYPHFADYSMSIKDQEVARIPLKQVQGKKTEILIYHFEPAAAGATLFISWGDQTWSIEIQPAG